MMSGRALFLIGLACAACARAVQPTIQSNEAVPSFDLRATRKPISVIRHTAAPNFEMESRFFIGFDAVIVAPNAGLRTPRRISVRDVPVISGGRLGSAQIIPPSAALHRFVLFHPPLAPNGDVVFRPAEWAALLAPYARARGIGIISLDDTPRSLLDALATGDKVENELLGDELPPVIIFGSNTALALFEESAYPTRIADPGGAGKTLSAVATWEPRRP
jgi:hypothetical protein